MRLCGSEGQRCTNILLCDGGGDLLECVTGVVLCDVRLERPSDRVNARVDGQRHADKNQHRAHNQQDDQLRAQRHPRRKPTPAHHCSAYLRDLLL